MTGEVLAGAGFFLTDVVAPTLGLAGAGAGAGAGIVGGLEAGAASAAVSYGAQKLLGPTSRGLSLPPPPGASAMSQEGAASAAMTRQRQAAAGGINSTITGAGNLNAPAAGSTTSGTKTLLGQ